MTSKSAGLSVIVVCYNEEDNIGACLESISWCDEIVVIDSFSTDRTVEICRRYTDRVIQRAWPGYRAQKEFAHSQATREWVLLIDADERVTPELREEIKEALSQSADGYEAFAIPRLVYYLGRWWWRGGWYPDYDIRLFQSDRARWGGTDPHERILVDGQIGYLNHPLHHYSYRDISDHVQRINRFTSISSSELRKQGERYAGGAVLHSFFRFLRFYFLKAGVLEGFPGFFIAATAAVYVFLKYAKLKDLELQTSNESVREAGKVGA